MRVFFYRQISHQCSSQYTCGSSASSIPSLISCKLSSQVHSLSPLNLLCNASHTELTHTPPSWFISCSVNAISRLHWLWQSEDWHKRIIWEALEIVLTEQLMNHEEGVHLSSAWLPLHSSLTGEREHVISLQLLSGDRCRKLNSRMCAESYANGWFGDLAVKEHPHLLQAFLMIAALFGLLKAWNKTFYCFLDLGANLIKPV